MRAAVSSLCDPGTFLHDPLFGIKARVRALQDEISTYRGLLKDGAGENKELREQYNARISALKGDMCGIIERVYAMSGGDTADPGTHPLAAERRPV